MNLKNLGERIKYLRKQLGLTQEEFGERLGIKGNTVTGYERGSRTPSESLINYICLVFNVNQTWLRTGEGELFLGGNNVTDPLFDLWSKYNCNNIEMEFLKSYFSLKKSDRTAFCKFLRKMFPDSIPELQDVRLDDLDDYQDAAALDLFAENEKLKKQNQELLAQNKELRAKNEVDVVAEVNELKQQNQELWARMEAMEKEDEEAEKEKPLKASKKKAF